MRSDETGYTLVEVVVVMAIFAVVMALTSVSFNRIVSSSGQITRGSETNVEGIIGLELLRTDLENAGFGLPWSYPAAVDYPEAVSQVVVPGCPQTDPSLYNDATSTGPVPPRAVVCGDNVGFNGSDYLVLKGSALGMSRTSRRWSYLTYSSVRAVPKPARTDSELVLGSNEYVVVLKEGVKRGELSKELVTGAGKFFGRFRIDASTDALSASFLPARPSDKHVVYGIDPDTAPRMPFNRADYYLERPADSSDISGRCAPGTAVLYKGVIQQADGGQRKYPILECVADLQVNYTLDQGSGPAPFSPQGANPLLASAQDVRDLVREIRVYILAHEGKRDPAYTFVPGEEWHGAGCTASDAVLVGEPGMGSCFRLSSLGSGWEHYRWKVYTVAVQPKNLN